MTLVVSRYNEDLEWTREFPVKIIYNKGDRRTIPDDLQKFVVDLPNIGREAHTYLYHIIKNYDALDETTIFCQGRYEDHVKLSPSEFRETFTNIQGFSKNYVPIYASWGRHYNFNIKDWGKPLGHPELLYGPWYEKIFGEYDSSLYLYVAAIFSVNKSHILNRTKEFYESLLKELEYHDSPQEAHFMERSWIQIFKINPLL